MASKLLGADGLCAQSVGGAKGGQRCYATHHQRQLHFGEHIRFVEQVKSELHPPRLHLLIRPSP